MPRRKTSQVSRYKHDNFVAEVGQRWRSRIAAVIRFGRNELRGAADLPQQVIIAESFRKSCRVPLR